ncbi:MAG: helix-turn-helix domain-containing protein [Clostridiales bacterium]|nr:helix-turn-helix domain-containing protein [Clostridiales bacterium]
MEQNTIYYISEAAKMVQVESHVLRYWEEELQLPIKRNEMGHRYYTSQDIRQLQEIKALKEQGLQLKAIRTILPETAENMEQGEEQAKEMVVNKAQKYMVTLSKDNNITVETQPEVLSEYPAKDEEKNQKAARLQYLLQHMIKETVKSANQELCEEVKESILKELDYQFRMKEERDEERWQKEEEHYRKIDEMIRQRHKPKEKLGKGKRKSPIV